MTLIPKPKPPPPPPPPPPEVKETGGKRAAAMAQLAPLIPLSHSTAPTPTASKAHRADERHQKGHHASDSAGAAGLAEAAAAEAECSGRADCIRLHGVNGQVLGHRLRVEQISATGGAALLLVWDPPDIGLYHWNVLGYRLQYRTARQFAPASGAGNLSVPDLFAAEPLSGAAQPAVPNRATLSAAAAAASFARGGDGGGGEYTSEWRNLPDVVGKTTGGPGAVTAPTNITVALEWVRDGTLLYYFRVRAFNHAGAAAWSAASYGFLPATPPYPTAPVTVTKAGVSLQWVQQVGALGAGLTPAELWAADATHGGYGQAANELVQVVTVAWPHAVTYGTTACLPGSGGLADRQAGGGGGGLLPPPPPPPNCTTAGVGLPVRQYQLLVPHPSGEAGRWTALSKLGGGGSGADNGWSSDPLYPAVNCAAASGCWTTLRLSLLDLTAIGTPLAGSGSSSGSGEGAGGVELALRVRAANVLGWGGATPAATLRLLAPPVAALPRPAVLGLTEHEAYLAWPPPPPPPPLAGGGVDTIVGYRVFGQSTRATAAGRTHAPTVPGWQAVNTAPWAAASRASLTAPIRAHSGDPVPRPLPGGLDGGGSGEWLEFDAANLYLHSRGEAGGSSWETADNLTVALAARLRVWPHRAAVIDHLSGGTAYRFAVQPVTAAGRLGPVSAASPALRTAQSGPTDLRIYASPPW